MFNTLQNGRRAKLETADGNEIDTMFMDKRSPSENIRGNGKNLVMPYLNNSVCSFSAVRKDSHLTTKIWLRGKKHQQYKVLVYLNQLGYQLGYSWSLIPKWNTVEPRLSGPRYPYYSIIWTFFSGPNFELLELLQCVNILDLCKYMNWKFLFVNTYRLCSFHN